MRFRQLYLSVVFVWAWGLLAVLAMTSNASADSPIRIMPLGDSLTAGTTDANWAYPFSFGYRGSLYTQLTTAGYDFQFVGDSPEPWNGAPYGVPPVIVGPDLRSVGQDCHRGYGGSSISNITYGTGYDPGILATLNADDPDIILLMIGINDLAAYGNLSNPETTKIRLANLTDLILATKPEVNLIVAQINSYKDGSLNTTTVAYNDYIRETLVPGYVAQGYHVSTVDQYANFVNSNGTFNQSLYSNIIHPNASGYQLMAETWFEGIEAILPVDPHEGPRVSGTYTENTTAPVLPANNLIAQGSETFSGSYAGGDSPEAWGTQLPDGMNSGVMTDANAPASTILAWDGVTDDFGWAVYQLDTTVNTFGYDVSEILSYAGWSGGRVNQAVEIKYALVGDTITEGEELGRTMGSFYYAPGNNDTPYAYTTMSVANDDDSAMLSGIAAIEVKYIDNKFNGVTGSIADVGNYSGYKQFAVIGTPTMGSTDIPGDANHDGKVDGSDVTILAGNWQVLQNASWDMGDFNGDGRVDGSDVTILAGNWQAGVNTEAASASEPSTLIALLGFLVMGTVARYLSSREKR